MKVKRFINAPDSVNLPVEERKHLAGLVKRFVPQAERVKIVASSDGPICEVTVPDNKGGTETRVGRVDAVVPGDLL